MVSFWPWKGDDTSPASFEKALSALSAKINKTSTKLETLRRRSRRLTVLWTLYAGFAYLLCAIVLVLVVGWRSWGPAEYTGIAVGPGIIYLGRLLLSTYYDYRISTLQASLDDLEKQRNTTIDKLKQATKYNTTQELLKKYGGSPTPQEKSAPKTKKPSSSSGAHHSNSPQQQQPDRRTSFIPPATANIPSHRLPSSDPHAPSTPQSSSSRSAPQPAAPPSPNPLSPTADFAPNAFTTPPQYGPPPSTSSATPTHSTNPTWYDRLMDVLLGEDESLPSKRLALICSHCRLVNGQAPPGVRDLADVGKWRCMSCGGMNGVEKSEVRRIVEAVKMEEEAGKGKGKGRGKAATEKTREAEGEGEESDVTQYSDTGEEGGEVKEEGQEEGDASFVPGRPEEQASQPTLKRRSRRVKSKASKTKASPPSDQDDTEEE